MSFTEKSYLLENGIQIATKEWGRDSSPTKMLCCHGFLDNANSFDKLIPHLLGKLDFHIVCIDFSGHGKSSHLPKLANYNLPQRICEILLLSHSLKWRKFILIGHSMGAFTSSIFAATYPELVSALILIEGIGAFLKPESAPEILRSYVDGYKLVMKKPKVYKTKEEIFKYMLKSRRELSHESIRLLMERGIVENEGDYSFSHDLSYHRGNAIQWKSEDVIDFLEKIECKTLLLYHHKEQFVYSLQEKVRYVRDIQVKGLNDGGHHLHLENPKETASIMIEFLSSLKLDTMNKDTLDDVKSRLENILKSSL